ncbi:MAG TPA: hypothetical protein VF152_05845 [Acidimicrobiia bacterium]
MRPRVLVVALLALGLLAACSDDSGSGPEGSGSERAERLPPNDFDQLAEMFDPELAPLGLRLTRGALVDTDGGYEVSDTGRHLAVYVEPVGDYTPADYVDGIVTTAQVFLPDVFERWDRLETFDVCQEPLPSDDDREEPPPVTQLYVARADAAAVEWETTTLPELVAATTPSSPSFRLYVAPAIASDPAYLEAAGAAS